MALGPALTASFVEIVLENEAASGFVAELEKAHLHPIWDRFRRLTPVQPAARDQPRLWRWQEIEPFAARTAAEVPAEHVERKALILAGPDFAGETVTTGGLIAAFTVLEPGDRARPHRHVMSALRFATQAEGAVTIVNGRRCAMAAGDLVITPPMCWHGHINEGSSRTVWFDATNMPLCNSLDANFFEPGDPSDETFWQVGEGAERLWQDAGISTGEGSDPFPKFHYPGTATRALLERTPVAPDGSRTVRYLNPATGGAVMPTIDCYAVRLASGRPTQPRRATWNTVCLVVSGTGRSRIGDKVFEWGPNDAFTLPHWTWFEHEALGGDADLFLVTDREAYARLELAREELGPARAG